MPRRALLIGSALDGLAGVPNDVQSIGDALQKWDFTIERCENDATRAGILAKYEQLIADTAKDDAVVVYYSGHGGYVQPPAGGAPTSELMDMQFIAPLDYHDSTDDNFRGITSVELSILLARLTRKTDNVTVVLDCCHAAQMSRDSDFVEKALKQLAPYERLRAHIDKLKLPMELLYADGNPHAVRIVACAPEQSAYEYGGVEGLRTGMLTESLIMALTAAQADANAISWATVIERVRRRVLTLALNQRPEVEGPARRLLFATAEEDVLTTLAVSDIGSGNVSLACATLLGVQKDDEFMIMPPGAPGPDATLKIGDLRIDTLSTYTAEGAVTFSGSHTKIPQGARAHRTKVSAPALPVRLPDAGTRSADLARAVSETPLVRVADDTTPPLAEVRIDADGGLTIHDRIGPLHAPRPGDAVGIALVMKDLKVLAQATALRALAGDPSWEFKVDVDIEWGQVRDGQKIPLKTSGEVVHAGDRIYFTVANRSPEAIYVTLIDIGVSGRISVLTAASRSGIRVAPNSQYTLGFDRARQNLTGTTLSWPAGLDLTSARPETVLVLVTSTPTDVSALEQDGITRSLGTVPNSPLAWLLEQLGTGESREIDVFDDPYARYDVHTINFELAAIPDEGVFLVDERPDPPTLHRVARGAPPMTVAVRLDELTVHRNRAMFATGIRIDALVLTSTGATAQPTYHAHTARFGNIRDGEQLPIDRMLIYHGPAVDYLDLAIWVSRDGGDATELGDLLAKDLSGSEVQEALLKLGGTVLAAPHAAAAAVIVGAGAVIVNVAYRLLRTAVGDAIGLYRGSMLANEQFGVGRHPANGARHIQDFSFAYTIEDVS